MILLDEWVTRRGEQDLKDFDIVAVEEPITVIFPHLPKFFFTCRPDAIVKRKRRSEVYILETKTSSSSWKLAELGVTNGEQASTYLYAVRSKYRDLEVVGVLPDIAYWNKETDNPSNIKIMRCDIVERSTRDLKEFALGACSILVDIAARIQALEQGKIHPVALFPRNTSWCNSFFRHCEYLPICRPYETIKRDTPPPGYVRDKWVEERVMKSIQPKLKGGNKSAKKAPARPTRSRSLSKPRSKRPA